MKLHYSITKETLSVYLDGTLTVVPSTDFRYELVKDYIQSVTQEELSLEKVRSLLSMEEVFSEAFNDLVEFVDDELYFDGEPLHGALVEHIMYLRSEGLPVDSAIAFLTNLMDNPSKRAHDCLWNFLDSWSAPITEDGSFIAYKNVKVDFTDVYTGTFDNSPGSLVSVPRHKVHEDPNVTCAQGLHVAAPSYLSHYAPGRKTVAVKVNPRDVVAVPTDYKHAKMRVCQYEVIEEVTGQPLV